MSFDVNKYEVVKNAVSPELSEFLYNYLMLKRDTAKVFYDTDYAPLYYLNDFAGSWGDSQVPYSDTFCFYSDTAIENLMLNQIPLMEKVVGESLYPTYTYGRMYKKGDILEVHKDRKSCEISTTVFLGGDKWNIHIEPDIKIDLDVGDMLIYSGSDLAHWREPFLGADCVQVFLHYNRTVSGFNNQFDYRTQIGLPKSFKKTNKRLTKLS